MPFYYSIDDTTPDGRRTASRLLALRAHLQSEIPRRDLNETLLLATWNIREFDSPSYGDRPDECLFYIAEIISHFDIVAVQEVRNDLRALERVQRILGSWWKYIVTDVTAGRRGNKERLCFLYDSRKVRFGGLASEVVVPPIEGKDGNRKITYTPADQLARTPFLCGFRAGWFKFMLCTVHIIYGESEPDDPRRIREIDELAKFLAERVADETSWTSNLVALGDFNIFSPADATFAAMEAAGFVIPDQIQRLPSNVPRNKHYDQIAFLFRDRQLNTTGRAGVFNFFESVYRDVDESVYRTQMGPSYRKDSKGNTRTAASKSRYYKKWRTYQMSDHLPMWVELQIDFGDDYLREKTRV